LSICHECEYSLVVVVARKEGRKVMGLWEACCIVPRVIRGVVAEGLAALEASDEKELVAVVVAYLDNGGSERRFGHLGDSLLMFEVHVRVELKHVALLEISFICQRKNIVSVPIHHEEVLEVDVGKFDVQLGLVVLFNIMEFYGLQLVHIIPFPSA